MSPSVVFMGREEKRSICFSNSLYFKVRREIGRFAQESRLQFLPVFVRQPVPYIRAQVSFRLSPLHRGWQDPVHGPAHNKAVPAIVQLEARRQSHAVFN